MDILPVPLSGTATDVLRISGKTEGLPDTSRNAIKPNLSEKSGNDTVTLSRDGKKLAQSNSSLEEGGKRPGSASGETQLTAQEVLQLQELKHRDLEVRIHEQAHLSAAGQYARGGASFTYQKGPDGVAYAVGGEVGIDLSKARTPEETITKMQTIKRAALAPASPSPADRSIASQAGMLESQARQEVLAKSQEAILQSVTESYPEFKQAPSANDQDSKLAQHANTYTASRMMIAAYQRTVNY